MGSAQGKSLSKVAFVIKLTRCRHFCALEVIFNVWFSLRTLCLPEMDNQPVNYNFHPLKRDMGNYIALTSA